MLDYKIILGAIALIISLVSYIPYVRDTVSGRTKPHALTWLIWSIVTGLAFYGQVIGNAGAGSWANGATAVTCFVVFVLSLFKGEKNIVLFDWICLAGAMLGLVLWAVAHQPVAALVLISIVDTIGFLPTIRKAYFKPREETLSLYVFSAIKYIFAFFALRTHSFLTWYYMLVLMVLNIIFTTVLVVRRRQLGQKQLP